MSTRQIVMLSVCGGLAYLTMVVIVGAMLTAHFKRIQRAKDCRWNEDWSLGIFFGSVIFIIGVGYLSWCHLTDKILNADTYKTCLLCGTKNDSDSSHCKHCGNLMGAELKE